MKHCGSIAHVPENRTLSAAEDWKQHDVLAEESGAHYLAIIDCALLTPHVPQSELTQPDTHKATPLPPQHRPHHISLQLDVLQNQHYRGGTTEV